MHERKTPRPVHSTPNTSWGGVAAWYDEHLEGNDDTYQKQVVLPNLTRVVAAKTGERIIDIACGQGFFSRELARAGAQVVGADISEELVVKARARSNATVDFFVAPSHKLPFAETASFDTAIIILAIQNIEDIMATFAEVRRVLKPGGRLILVMNHPAFRIPQRTHWGWDPETHTQYRRADRYLSAERISIIAHPGQRNSPVTISYHRSLQDFFKPLAKNGFAVARLEEWISHKRSSRGARQKAEDMARKEFPLFMMLEAKKLA